MINSKVAVCSRSFSLHPVLREELRSSYTEVKFNDEGLSLKGESLVEFLKGYDKAIVALEVIDDHVLKSLPQLKVIGKYGVGLDKLDFHAMKKYGVQMGWTPGVNAQSVAELALAFSLNIVRNIQVSNRLIQNGEWRQIQGKQLSSMTFGLLGCGNVGKRLVKLLTGFGCKILVHDIEHYSDFYKQYNIEAVAFDELFSRCDVVSIHIPKNDQTENLVGEKELKLMKKGSYLINTARGGIVNEDSLLTMLEQDHLASVAFDVFKEEPPVSRKLLDHPKMFATTHIGGSSEEAVLAMGRAAILGLDHSTDVSVYEKYR